MFQSFDTEGDRAAGPGRLAALRQAMAEAGLSAFIVPRADAHQGEYVAPRDARLQWLTGFTGSAGIAAITADEAAIFVDGRYTVQVSQQVEPLFDPRPFPAERPSGWLADRLTDGDVLGFDPWLHTRTEIDQLCEAVGDGVELRPLTKNPLDRIWTDQPEPPSGAVRSFPEEIAGMSRQEKIDQICETLAKSGEAQAVITLPDSLCWLLNIRGSDVPRNPVAHGFAIIDRDTRSVSLFMEPEKLDGAGTDLTALPPSALIAALANLSGPVRVDRDTAPVLLSTTLEDAGIPVSWGADPCILPKARKTPAEIKATHEAHQRDAAVMCRFLHWLDTQRDAIADGATLTEIDVVTRLEEMRRDTGLLRDISFDTIAGTGPHAAMPHYRVTHESNRQIAPNDLLLVDSGGQYEDGTTDITRTVAMGTPTDEQINAFTRVLKGMIDLSRTRWPKGLSGADLDPLARAALWRAGLDYDHGTGHGVGVALSVHEGPQRISRVSRVPLEPGMILSNEPGYYREGDFGIRIENLVVVVPAHDLPHADPDREMLAFDTLTWAPIDRRLIDINALSRGQRAWIDAYHGAIASQMTGRVPAEVAHWLGQVCAPLET
ncbi:aminopeptidase P family protein [Palleronia caenipelagi]|uniref:Aminopeptidase P family protein n=1 Tax=Palleronia caenipelagi TaxID=2489174 RepID=A0A547QB54_9RHOB|nr:aminopeptidase P family protein [Palleronia caenipelagi]TRD23623.1 aminopeptidase P family protein [Palleronia caenipelagi]